MKHYDMFLAILRNSRRLNKTIYSSSRNIHIYGPCQQLKEDEITVKDVKIVPKDSEVSKALEFRKKQKMKEAPKTEEKRDSLPHFDRKRLTPEMISLNKKAHLMFDEIADKRGATKESFQYTTELYITKEKVYRRGAIEFMYAGIAEMKRFGVERDIGSYKKLLQVYPEGKMIPENWWQIDAFHYPRQQMAVMDLIMKMEEHDVMPDQEFGRLLKNRFGNKSDLWSRYAGSVYWMSKMKNWSPYPVPQDMPDKSPIDQALVVLKRMSVDRSTEYKVWKTAEMIANPEEDTFIVSAQSPTQKRLLEEHDTASALIVEGPFHVVARFVVLEYFLLRANPKLSEIMKKRQFEKEDNSDENLLEWKNFYDTEDYQELCPVLSVHEQDDMTVLALCITGTSSKSSIVDWIRCLEKENPNLAKSSVLFQFRTPPPNTELQVTS